MSGERDETILLLLLLLSDLFPFYSHVAEITVLCCIVHASCFSAPLYCGTVMMCGFSTRMLTCDIAHFHSAPTHTHPGVLTRRTWLSSLTQTPLWRTPPSLRLPGVVSLKCDRFDHFTVPVIALLGANWYLEESAGSPCFTYQPETVSIKNQAQLYHLQRLLSPFTRDDWKQLCMCVIKPEL